MNLLKKLHRDEEGLETLQVVLIVGVAALILAAIKVFWPQLKQWATDSVNNTEQGW
jgi:hypothetical protein